MNRATIPATTLRSGRPPKRRRGPTSLWPRPLTPGANPKNGEPDTQDRHADSGHAEMRQADFGFDPWADRAGEPGEHRPDAPETRDPDDGSVPVAARVEHGDAPSLAGEPPDEDEAAV